MGPPSTRRPSPYVSDFHCTGAASVRAADNDNPLLVFETVMLTVERRDAGYFSDSRCGTTPSTHSEIIGSTHVSSLSFHDSSNFPSLSNPCLSLPLSCDGRNWQRPVWDGDLATRWPCRRRSRRPCRRRWRLSGRGLPTRYPRPAWE